MTAEIVWASDAPTLSGEWEPREYTGLTIRTVRAAEPWKAHPRKRGSRVTTRLDGAAYWQHRLAQRGIRFGSETGEA